MLLKKYYFFYKKYYFFYKKYYFSSSTPQMTCGVGFEAGAQQAWTIVDIPY